MNPANLEQAACKKMHPGVFFPQTAEGVEIAKAVCRRCPVREQCLANAIRQNIHDGIFGGHTSAERRRMHRRAKAFDPPRDTSTNPRQVKDCPTCKRALDRADFAANSSRPDGLQGECRACQMERNRRLKEARRKAS